MQRRTIRPVILFILILTVSACSPSFPIFLPPAKTVSETRSSTPTDQPQSSVILSPEFTPNPTSTETPSPTQTLPPTPTYAPLNYWISSEVPGWLIDRNKIPPSLTLADGVVDDALTLGLAERMPEGRVLLKEAQIVFALAAPFKTVQDEVSLADLQAAWQGSLQGSTSHLTQIAVYEGDYHALVALLGGAPGGDVISETVLLLPDGLENLSEHLNANTWAIVPFDRLQPEYKVIAISGVSPLQDDFEQQPYALRGLYALYVSEQTLQRLPMSDQNALIEALPPTNRDESRITTLVMTGVTALVRATAYRMEIYGNTYPGEDIVDWLSSADITHISNEVSFYEDCPYPDPFQSSLSFCSQPKYIELLDYVGADVIELTGNHNNDANNRYGVDVVPSTLALYDEHEMLTYGGGLNLADSMLPALIEHHGNKLAFIGCNPSGPDFAWATDNSGGAAPCGDYAWMMEEIQQLAEEGYLSVATLQYYEDYSSYASPQMKEDFRQLAQAGAVIINGSQAHTPKEFEFYNGSFIHYGLGNLFFDQMTIEINGISYPETRNEFIQRHIIYDSRLISTQLLTAVLEDYAKPRPMSLEERQLFLSEIFSVSD